MIGVMSVRPTRMWPVDESEALGGFDLGGGPGVFGRIENEPAQPLGQPGEAQDPVPVRPDFWMPLGELPEEGFRGIVDRHDPVRAREKQVRVGQLPEQLLEEGSVAVEVERHAGLHATSGPGDGLGPFRLDLSG